MRFCLHEYQRMGLSLDGVTIPAFDDYIVDLVGVLKFKDWQVHLCKHDLDLSISFDPKPNIVSGKRATERDVHQAACGSHFDPREVTGSGLKGR